MRPPAGLTPQLPAGMVRPTAAGIGQVFRLHVLLTKGTDVVTHHTPAGQIVLRRGFSCRHHQPDRIGDDLPGVGLRLEQPAVEQKLLARLQPVRPGKGGAEGQVGRAAAGWLDTALSVSSSQRR
jgi:hypothetical protein